MPAVSMAGAQIFLSPAELHQVGGCEDGGKDDEPQEFHLHGPSGAMVPERFVKCSAIWLMLKLFERSMI